MSNEIMSDWNKTIVENILNELRVIEENYLKAIRLETNKVKERNWLSLDYLYEKTGYIKKSMDYIEEQALTLNKE